MTPLRSVLLAAAVTLSAPARAATTTSLERLSDVEQHLASIVESNGPVMVLAALDAQGVAQALVASHPDWNLSVHPGASDLPADRLDLLPECAVHLTREDTRWIVGTGAACTHEPIPPLGLEAVEDLLMPLTDREITLVVANGAASGLAEGLRADLGARGWSIRPAPPQGDPALALAAATLDGAACAVYLAPATGGWKTQASLACFGPKEPFAQATEPTPSLATPMVAPTQTGLSSTPPPAQPELAVPATATPEPTPAVAAAVPPPALPPEPRPLDGTEALEAPVVKSRWGGERWMLITYGAVYGAYLGGATAFIIGDATDRTNEEIGQSVAAATLLASGGGGVLAGVLSGHRDYSYDEVMLLYTGTAVGGYYGQQLGRIIIEPDAPSSDARTMAAALGGSALGMGLSIALGRYAQPVAQQAHFLAATGMGMIAATGMNDLAEWTLPDDRRPRAVVSSLTALSFGGAAMAWNLTGHDVPPWYVLTTYGVVGGWLGTWMPQAILARDVSATEFSAGLRIGLGFGYGLSLAATAIAEPSPRSVTLQGIGMVTGSALGAGFPMAIDPKVSPQVVALTLLGGATTGAVAGALLAPSYADLDPENWATVTTLGTWTAYQTVGWSLLGGHLAGEPRQSAGLGLTAAGISGVATLALSPFVPLTIADSVMTVSGGAWGTWVGAWTGALLDLDPATHWALTLGVGNAGLIGTAIGTGLSHRTTWSQVAWVDGLGLAGAAIGGVVGALFFYDPEDWHPMAASALIGSGVGLATGITLAFVAPGPAPEPLRGGGIKLPGLAFGLRPTVSPETWVAADGSPGFAVRVNLHEVR